MRVSDLQLHFARDRASIISAVVPKGKFTHLQSRLELSQDENGVLCDIFLGDTRIESFYPSDFVPDHVPELIR